jgi:cephalosporin-C deacetylase-like acetyl esterase
LPEGADSDTVRRMVEPEDFGYPPLATLARIADPTRSPRHVAFWKNWWTAVQSQSPRLHRRDDVDLSDPTATHEFVSAREVRIGCTLALPKGPAVAAIITLHGYEDTGALEVSAGRWKQLIAGGVAVLAVRVRGYPGSQRDVPRLVEHAGVASGGEWITYGLDVPVSDAGYGCEWVFSYAVADVVNACRALRLLLDRQSPGLPLFIHGESMGAALAIIATAQLAEREPETAPSRLGIALPSMGDWPWRLEQDRPLCRGIGGIIRRAMMENRGREGEVAQLLRLFDTVVHARRIRCPVLCKLAMLDDVVPAPTAAAVFNALGSDTGLKWRYITRYGHFDGGLADLRRHAAFERQLDMFLDPSTDPSEALIDETPPIALN